ncbi:MAG: hypothetical protein AAF629_00135 [Chloroflexota bacterium]
MDRRRFLRMAGISAAGGLATYSLAKAQLAEASSDIISYSGADFSDNGSGSPWDVVLGDGLYAAPDQAAPDANDLGVMNLGGFSTLEANTQGRGVMAHNIAFNRRIDDPNSSTSAFDYTHLCKIDFRLPQLPATDNPDFNAQTMEITFFIWDGSNKLGHPDGPRDYGVALQWMLNPWMSEFGNIRIWSSSAGEAQWTATEYSLTPDTNTHTAELLFDYHSKGTALIIDGNIFPCALSETPKVGWGTETAARMSAEIISIYPGQSPTAPSFSVEFSNWQWDWIPSCEVSGGESTEEPTEKREKRQKKCFDLEAEVISNDEALDEIFTNLMQFNQWDKAGIDAWIDLVSVHEGSDPALAHFTSDDDSLFFIQIRNSKALKRRQVMKLNKKIRRINRRYMKKHDKPILALMLL